MVRGKYAIHTTRQVAIGKFRFMSCGGVHSALGGFVYSPAHSCLAKLNEKHKLCKLRSNLGRKRVGPDAISYRSAEDEPSKRPTHPRHVTKPQFSAMQCKLSEANSTVE